MKYTLYEENNGIGLLTINNPDALNAVSAAVMVDLAERMDEIAASSTLRCLLLTGAGEKAFVAGADIAEMAAFSPEEAKRFCAGNNKACDKIEQLAVPVIALVNGYALGGGFELALCCDLRIASSKAVFSFPETSLGITPGSGGLHRIQRIVGMARGRELMFTGRRVKPDEALSMGLVNAVVEPDKLMEAGYDMAGKIAANAPLAIQACKRVMNQSMGLTLQEASNVEQEAFASCFGTEDQRSAMQAFVEKRKPEPFKGQ